MYFCTCLKEQVASFGFVCGTIGGLQVTGSLGRQRFSGSRAEIFRARMSSFSIGMGSNSLEGKNGTIRQGSCSQIGWNEMSFGLRNCVTNRKHWFFFWWYVYLRTWNQEKLAAWIVKQLKLSAVADGIFFLLFWRANSPIRYRNQNLVPRIPHCRRQTEAENCETLRIVNA